MFEALIVTLREGIEAALVVGIIVAFLRREGYGAYLSSVTSGLVAAVAASLLSAWVLYRWAVNEELLEGLLYLTSAVIVLTMTLWMWRHARSISGEVKGTLARIVSRDRTGSVAAGLFVFTFLMVFREGVETVLFLSALSLTSGYLLTLLGVLVGLALAVVFGVLFVRGSLRIDLGRFFKITGIALLIFVVQLLINGYHELAEGGWLPANETSMASIGPLVKNEYFFVAAVLVLPLLMLLVPGRQAAAPAADPDGSADPASPANPAEIRLERSRQARQTRARMVGGILGVVILATLGLGFVYTRPPAQLSPAARLEPAADGTVRIPLASFQGMVLHRYTVTLAGTTVRFIAVPLDQKLSQIATAFDACEICGTKGYYQDGANITCLHCGSAIYPPSIGQHGGCNPIPLRSHLEGGALVLTAADLAGGKSIFAGGR